MTNQTHPITPPEDLLQQLLRNTGTGSPTWCERITIAYQAGADQELEACTEWLFQDGYVDAPCRLRNARRPKPPSLKDQALHVLASAPGPDYPSVMTVLNADEHALIRKALEALPND